MIVVMYKKSISYTGYEGSIPGYKFDQGKTYQKLHRLLTNIIVY